MTISYMLSAPGLRIQAVAAAVGFALILWSGCAGTHRPLPVEPERSTPYVVDPDGKPDPPQEVDPEPSHEPVGVWHIVQRGETLWRIARAYDSTVEMVATVNRVADPATIEVDTPLWIPGATHIVEVTPAPSTSTASTGDWVWPVPSGRILSGFGAPRRTHRHTGIDIGGPAGRPVLASRAGRVIYRGATMRGYGKTVILDHGNGLQSLYAHNSALLVDVGDQVTTGETIARLGRTGNASTEHCHFEIRRRNVPVDPMGYVAPEASR